MSVDDALLALSAIPIIPLLVVCLLSRRHVSRQGDEARRGFIWFHIACWLLLLSLLLQTISIAVSISPYDIGYPYREEEAIDHLQVIGALFIHLSWLAIIVSIATMATGASQVSNQQQSKRVSAFIGGIAALGTAIFISVFIYNVYFTVRIWRDDISDEAYNAFYWVDTLGAIILLIATIANTAFASIKRNAALNHVGPDSSHFPMRRVWNLLIGASGVSLFIMLWVLTLSLALHYNYGVESNSIEWGVNITNVLVTRWGTVIVFVLIYLLGSKKSDGLWSENNAPQDMHWDTQVV